MRAHWYILDGHTPVASDPTAWAIWFEANQDTRVVRQEKVNGAAISTVFLGIDHSYGDGPPILFETMIFGGEHNDYQDRCSTWKQAEAMHETACALARGNPSN